jgi:hypothetical protein
MSASNTLVTPTVLTRETLMHLKNQMVLSSKVDRKWESAWTGGMGYNGKVGTSINIRIPNEYQTRSNSTFAANNTVESVVQLNVNSIIGGDLEWSSQDRTQKLDLISDRYIKPLAIKIANDIDVKVAGLYKDIHNVVGTAGSTPNATSAITDVMTRLNNIASPDDNRCIVINPNANGGLLEALRPNYNQGIVEGVLRRGYLGPLYGMDLLMSQNILNHTGGDWLGTPAIATTSTTLDETLDLDGFDAVATMKKGDVFTIADVYDVNPISKQSTGFLKEWVVTADAVADGGGLEPVLAIAPAIIVSGAYQNCDSLPTENALVTIKSGTGALAHVANMAFCRETFALAVAPLELPEGAYKKARFSQDGLSIRMIQTYNEDTDHDRTRLDVLCGAVTTRARTGVILMG